MRCRTVILFALSIFIFSSSAVLAASSMKAGDVIRFGQSMTSPEGSYQLTIGTGPDGSDELRTVRIDGVHTWGITPFHYIPPLTETYAILQTDGNFVFYTSYGSPIFDTGTWNCCASGYVILEFAGDGNLQLKNIIDDPSGRSVRVLWESGYHDPSPPQAGVYPLKNVAPPGPTPTSPALWQAPKYNDSVWNDNTIPSRY